MANEIYFMDICPKSQNMANILQSTVYDRYRLKSYDLWRDIGRLTLSKAFDFAVLFFSPDQTFLLFQLLARQ